MKRRRVFALLGSLGTVWLGACTTDFGGYHLRSDSSGGSSVAGSDMISGGSTSPAGDVAGEPAEAGAGPGADPAASQAGGGGAATTANDALGGAGGESSGGVTPSEPPSCLGLSTRCGAAQSRSCCSASLVPGGSYARSALSGDSTSVSDFMLDDYEVTVGRFTNFVHAFTLNMIAEGSGKNPHNPSDPGWSSAWNGNLPAGPSAFEARLQCSGGTFASDPESQARPVTCVSWYEAYAFCIWDGGRLPTEAEWNYAAAAGAEERTYPWGDAPPDDTNAVFCPAGACSKIQGVGTKLAGAGKWGQLDLAGNAWEWNLDVYKSPYREANCRDCADTGSDSSSLRVFRGGSAGNDAAMLGAGSRYSRDPADHNGFIGLRCARDP